MSEKARERLQAEVNAFSRELVDKIFTDDHFGICYLAGEIDVRLRRLEQR